MPCGRIGLEEEEEEEEEEKEEEVEDEEEEKKNEKHEKSEMLTYLPKLLPRLRWKSQRKENLQSRIGT